MKRRKKQHEELSSFKLFVAAGATAIIQMNTQGSIITRQEMYEAVWLIPLSELAKKWNASPEGIRSVCQKMNIPYPDSDFWVLAQQGMQPDPPPLPAATPDLPSGAQVMRPEPETEPASPPPRVSADDQIKNSSKIEVPATLENVHRFVKQTRRALTSKAYLRNGFVETHSIFDRPLRLQVSPEQLDRALRICDAIIKEIIKRGGKFELDPENRHLRLYVGKQAVDFRIREVVNRFDLKMSQQEKEANGYMSWDRSGWRGTGRLKFIMSADYLFSEKTWEDSKRFKLEDWVGNIVDELANTEKEATRIRTEREQREKSRAEAEARKEAEAREWNSFLKAAESQRRIEQENRKRLEQMAKAWRDARLLRRFIRTCESVMRSSEQSSAGDAWEQRWLAWARTHADRIDPMTNGYLEAERKQMLNLGT